MPKTTILKPTQSLAQLITAATTMACLLATPALGAKEANSPNKLSQTVNDCLTKAKASAQKQDWKQAASDYSQALEKSPHNIQALTGRASAYWQLGDQASALRDSNTLAALEPDNIDILTQNSEYLMLANVQWAKVLSNANRILKKQPQSLEALLMKGDALVRTGKPAEGIQTITKVVNRTKPKDKLWVQSINTRSWANLVASQWSGTVSDLDLYMTYYKGNEHHWYSRADALHNLKRDEEALISINKSISLNPKYADAYVKKATILQALHKHPEAIEACSNALRIDTQLWDVYRLRAKSYKALGDYDRELKDVCRAMSR